jgi:hypothetical protein
MPYLRSLRKSDLVLLAEISDLKGFEDYKKVELEAALDEHLRANTSIFSADKRLADYYRRLAQLPRVVSPIKLKTEPAASGDEAKKLSRRRQTNKVKDDVEVTDDSDSQSKTPASTALAVPARTPARSSLSFASSLPPSPAIVTDAIERQTTVFRKSVSEAWSASGVSERFHALRAALSSGKSIKTLIIVIELFSLIYELVPLQFLTTVPAVEALRSPEFGIRVPDLFILLSSSFWAPFSLWSLTSLILPLISAYFFNLSYKPPPPRVSHPYETRRSSAVVPIAAAPSFDPLVYNVAKALIVYLVYATHFTFWDLYSDFTIEKVNVSIPGQWPALVTGAAIGIVTSLYEAILKK